MNARDLTEESLNTLHKIIIEVGETYPNYGESIPKPWMPLQQEIYRLKQAGQRIIEFQTLVDLNSKMDTHLKEDELLLFTSLLHHTGYSLHFQKVDDLKDLIMLDPKLIMDAMKCFVTVKQFALKVWKKHEWEIMRKSGRVEEAYIVKLWKKKSDPLFYRYHKYLLRVMKELDLICFPKVYNKDGCEVPQSSFFVPSMVKDDPPPSLSTLTKMSSEGSLQIRFEFADILPPAVYNRLVCSSLTLWQVHEGQLYDGFVTLESGSHHLLVFQRESQAITVSLLHIDTDDVDLDLCRAVRLFLNQTIQRILSSYDVITDDQTHDVFKITFRPASVGRQIEERDEMVRILS